jgi:CSLREA domain-containing protein
LRLKQYGYFAFRGEVAFFIGAKEANMESKKNFFIAVLVAVLMLSLVSVPVTYAKRFVVDTTVDDVDANPGDGICDTGDSVCTLRAAIEEANAWSGSDRIAIPAGNYILDYSTDSLEITDDLVIRGKGADQTTIDFNQGLGGFRIIGDFKVVIKKVTVTGTFGGPGIYSTGGRLTINGCEIRNNIGSDFDAGGIQNFWGYLNIKNSKISNNYESGILSLSEPSNISEVTISDSIISGNEASGGGGIFNWGGILKVYRSEIIENGAYEGVGGGILSQPSDGVVPDVTIIDSTIARNTAGGVWGPFGGGVANRGDMVIIKSKIFDNTAASILEMGIGGGIANTGNLIIKGSVISGNESDDIGGGILNWDDGDLTVMKSVITENTAASSGGGIYNNGTVTLKNTIIEYNVPDDCLNCP